MIKINSKLKTETYVFLSFDTIHEPHQRIHAFTWSCTCGASDVPHKMHILPTDTDNYCLIARKSNDLKISVPHVICNSGYNTAFRKEINHLSVASITVAFSGT